MAAFPHQFSLRSSFAMPIFVGAYFQVRGSATLQAMIGWSLLWAVAAALYRSLSERPRSSGFLKEAARMGAATGALVTFLLTCPVAIELLTQFAIETNHEYWNWYRDWPQFCCQLFVVVTAGAFLGAASGVLGSLPVLLSRRN